MNRPQLQLRCRLPVQLCQAVRTERDNFTHSEYGNHMDDMMFTHGKCLSITLIMAGNSALGPLAENAATLGDRTPLPTTLKVREIFTTGILDATKLKH